MSSLTKKVYVLEEDITNLAAIIEKQTAKKVIIVAHSMGGILALPIANRIKNFSGFIGIEPTTREIFFNPPQGKGYVEQAKKFKNMTEEQLITNMQRQTKKNFSKEQNKLLWKHYYQDDQRDSESKSAQQQEELIQSVSKYEKIRFSQEIPVTIFTQKFRKAEYERSEYTTDKTKIICVGNNHYLFWDFPEQVAAEIIKLI